jgi:hypothetical protein
VIHASTNPTSFPSRSLLLHAGLSLNKATQYGDFRTYHRIGGHCDNGGRDCAWGVCCCCSTLHTDRHCTESRLGRLDHMCWLRESRDLTLKHLDWQLTLPRSSASRTQSQPPKDVGPNLLNLLATLVNTRHSRVWHGSTLLGSLARNENEQLLLVLDLHLGLLCRPLFREDLDSTSIPSCLRPKELPNRLLRLDRFGHSLQLVGDP